MKVITKSGFSCEVDENAVGSWEFTRTLADMIRGGSEEKLAGMVKITDTLLDGKAQTALLMHLDPEGGNPPANEVFAEVNEILAEVKEKRKN